MLWIVPSAKSENKINLFNKISAIRTNFTTLLLKKHFDKGGLTYTHSMCKVQLNPKLPSCASVRYIKCATELYRYLHKHIYTYLHTGTYIYIHTCTQWRSVCG